MNRFLYSLIIYFGIPIAISKLLLKDTHDPFWKNKLKNQLGIIDKVSGKIIWIHCVSVGEFNASKPLIDQLFILYPMHKILVSTSTMTGSNEVKKYYKNKVTHCFFPLDAPLIINSFIAKINPEVCILLETEIWPNLIHSLQKKKIPVMLVNARLSEKSFERYLRYSSRLVKKSLSSLNMICSQNAFSSNRFIALGADIEKVINTGSLKFDSQESSDLQTISALKKVTGERAVIVFASTRDGEEKQIVDSYLKSKKTFSSLLIIVPRHPERFNEAFKIAKSSGLIVEKRSQINQCSPDTEILIGDSMGELMSYYAISDIAFVGGSLSNNGGQNMLEAASLSKPIIFGPSVYNFEEISKKLLDDDAAIQVANADELMHTISELLSNDSRRKELGFNAKKTFDQNRGAANKIIDVIKPHIEA